MEIIKVFLTDDHKMFRDGIRTMLAREKNITVVGEADTAEEAIEAVIKLKPDVILMDISLDGMSGITATKLIKQQLKEVKILALTMHGEEHYVVDMLDAGASGYVMKNTGRAELLNAVQTVAAGDSYISKEASDKLLSHILRNRTSGKSKQSNGTPITKREREILVLIAEELTPREIAKKLFISPRTVDSHRRNLMQKLELKNTASLVKYAVTHKMVDFEAVKSGS